HRDKQFAVTIAGALLDGCRRAAEVDGAQHGAVLGVNDGDVGGAVGEDVDVLGERVEENAVGAAGDGNGLDDFVGFRIPHDDGVGGAEAVAGLGIDNGAVHAVGRGDGGEGFEGVEVENFHAIAAGDEELAVFGIGCDVVHAAGAADGV